MLYSLGQHRALCAVQSKLRVDERLFAFLDDIYVVCSPERVFEIYKLLEEELWRHSRIQIHAGKTQIWNSGGHVPDGVDDILRIAQVADPDARVWFGDHALPLAERGIRVLGTPLGHGSYVQAQLRSKAASHRVLLERIPAIPDLQSAWLLLLFCASPRANNYLRVVHPTSSQAFANEHDQDIWRCFSTLLGQVSGFDQWEVASVPQCLGGLGLRSEARTAPAAYWASWADSVGMFRQRHRDVAASVAAALTDPPTHAHHLQGAADSRGFLHSVGFETAEWAALADGLRPTHPSFHDIEPGVPTHGWQFFAARAIEEHFVSSSIVPRLSPTESALLRSQSGPMAGLPFSVVPSSSFARFCPQLFRVLLLRRLWLPLPLSSRTCRCGRPLDIFGHHRAACSRAGILGSRGFALESAAAWVCREGGGRVATNLFLRDLDVPVPVTDSRRLEVVCDGLPLFRGAQLALDTTLVSPVCSNGEPRGRSAVEDGAALSSARRRKARTYPELCGPHSRACLVVLAAETGGRWSEEAHSFLSQLA